MNGYVFLDVDCIPDCCGSCSNIRFREGACTCGASALDIISEDEVCIFGICDSFSRKYILKRSN